MEISKIKSLHKAIDKHLSHKELKSAIDMLYEFNEAYPNWQIKDEIQTMEQSYKFMLKYMLDGIDDPERDKFYEKLILQCYKINDILADTLLIKEDSSLYYSKKRSILSHRDTLQDSVDKLDDVCSKISLAKLLPMSDRTKEIELEKEAEQVASDIFYNIWVLFPLKSQDIETLNRLFSDITVPNQFIYLFISALTLNLIRNFDEAGLSILIDKAQSDEIEVKERALVGLIFVVLLNREKFSASNDVKNRIALLLENDTVKRLVKKIQLQLIKSKETERITRKLNEDILPEMMKLSSKIGNNLDPNELINDLKENEINPEWEGYLKESGISDKLKEINNLQLEGSDVMMGTFSNLKTFPFFFNMSNWFMPFFKESSIVYNVETNLDSPIIKAIESSRYLCNSDKYSFLLSMGQIPAQQRDSLSSQINSQNEALEELRADEKSTNPEIESESISNKYIQDLYRFFKLFARKNEFEDPFEGDINFFNIGPFDELFKDKKDIMLIAELNFRKEFYDAALLCFDKILLLDSSDYEVYQKTGFCYQQLHNYEKSIDAYVNADIIHPDSLWTLKKIASCYRSLKEPEKALEYYLRALHISPDNKSLEMLAGHCYLEMKNYEKAINHYFKVDYLEPNNTRSWRAIAWSSFLMRKFDQSKKYYEKILSSKPDYSDYMNAGHTELLIGNIREALDYYKESLNKLDGDVKKFDDFFNQDISVLVDAGVKKEQIPLIKDQLLYSL